MIIPDFKIYWEWDSNMEKKLRWDLSLRLWTDLNERDKNNIILYFIKNDWINEYSETLVKIWKFFNESYMELCPFKELNKIIPERDYARPEYRNLFEMKKAAFWDFKTILLSSCEEIVYKVITKFAREQIDFYRYNNLSDTSIKDDIDKAFEKFDKFCNCFNHISEQYSLKVILTREWLIPKQDEIIINKVYIPTISLLQNPKWELVNIELIKVFDDFQNKKYSSVISGSHNVVQKFLQIFLWEKEENGKWAFWKYFSEFKKNEEINNEYTKWIIWFTQNFLSSERAEKSDAKPWKKVPLMEDALLVMNSSLVFINYCLLKSKK